MTPEQKKAGVAPVLVEDPETHESCVIVKEETYRRLSKVVEVKSVVPSFLSMATSSLVRVEMKILDRLPYLDGRRP